MLLFYNKNMIGKYLNTILQVLVVLFFKKKVRKLLLTTEHRSMCTFTNAVLSIFLKGFFCQKSIFLEY